MRRQAQRSAGGVSLHKHHEEDEFFYDVDGHFLSDLEEKERTVELAPNQGFVDPRGVAHRTRAPERTVILISDPHN